MSARLRRMGLGLLAIAMTAWLAGAAYAVPQYTHTPGELLHTDTSGQPGAEWDTDGLAAGGEISYDSGLQRLTVTGGVEVLNYHGAAACPDNVLDNCALNFGPDLEFTLEADLDSINIAPLFGTFIGVQINFKSTGGTDLLVTDPADGGSMMLTANLVGGTFNGSPTNGIQASIVFDTATGTALQNNVVAGAILQPTGGDHAGLFGTVGIGLGITTASDFIPTLNALMAAYYADYLANPATATLGNFTAEGAGEVFRVEDGSFELPEPTTALLLLGGLFAFARTRRS